MKIIKYALTVVALIALDGCASMSSTIDKDGDYNKGIAYYMPKRDIRIDITVAADNFKTTHKHNVDIKTTGNEKIEDATKTITDTTDIDYMQSSPVSSIRKVTVEIVDNHTNEALPDTETRFFLNYRKNLLGQNSMGIGINNIGLLNVSKNKTINRSDEIASNIAIDVASASIGAGFLPTSATPEQPNKGLSTLAATDGKYFSLANRAVEYSVEESKTCAEGKYSFKIDPNELKNSNDQVIKRSYCGVEIQAERLFNILKFSGKNAVDDFNESNFQDDFFHNLFKKNVYGLFYKQDLPYKVTVSTTHDSGSLPPPPAVFIALSPTESKIYMAPISRTLFTDNTSDISLENGIVSSYNNTTDSELYALSKIPANIMGSYTSAIGNIFGNIKGISANKASDQGSQYTILQTAAKIKNCQIIIANNPVAGLKGDDLTKALTNIQAGCAN